LSQLTIKHYAGYEADKRLSMDIYADAMLGAFNTSDKLLVSQFRPESWLEKYADSRMIMRYLRYWSYPQSIKGGVADLHHVLDHGYAHLHSSLGTGSKCISVHDLIPFLTWKGVISEQKPSRKPSLNIHSLSFLDRYDAIIAISQSTKNDLVNYLSIPEDRIRVISPPIAPQFRKLAIDKVMIFAEKYKLNPQCKWVMVSGAEFYKNHEASLKAFRKLIDLGYEDLRLIKTGKPSREFTFLIESLGLSEYVTELFLDDFSELPLLYNFIDCLMFPSLYEGFGMPVAEALACGTPVVISKRGSLPEVAGDLCSALEPNDIDGLAQELSKSLSDEALIDYISEKGPEFMQRFSVYNTSKELTQFYSSII